MSATFSAASAAALESPAPGTTALADRLLNFILFVTVLLSSVVFIEPSPHDGMMMVLLVMCFAARLPFDRKLVPLLLILFAWLIGGWFALLEPVDQEQKFLYDWTSFYLALATLTFACLFSAGNMIRLAILRRAYIIAAVLATVAGYIGFFHLLPGSDIFLDNERVSATFKDPNVYGPFLVFPLLMLMFGLVTNGFRLSRLALLLFLMGGLFLSFSRGAWIHFAVSATIGIFLLYANASDSRMRSRIVLLIIIAVIGAALLFIAMTSIDSVRDMLLLRAKAIQPYDVGPGGRFSLQKLALSAILDHPNGMGPSGFGLAYGGQQHNVYMQCFLVYGWLGGTMYLTLVMLTFVIGFANVRVRTPWQPFLIAAYATFIGEALEGMIVDTDHWRHFFLVVGMVWGLSVANINLRRGARARLRAEDEVRLAARSVA